MTAELTMTKDRPVREATLTVPSEAGSSSWSTQMVDDAAQRRGLRCPPHVVGQVVAAIEAGKHPVLTGPPGTGKTTLAHLAAEQLCVDFLPVTATALWSERDTIGDTVQGGDGPVFRPGVFVEALDTGRWIVIDEMNRSDFDAAFGQLFTVLSGQAVVLPHRRNPLGRRLAIVPARAEVPRDTEPVAVPAGWRMLATMNGYDGHSTRTLPDALKRRFAFIEVGVPPVGTIEQLLGDLVGVIGPLIPLGQIRGLGPAFYLDGADFACRRLQDGVTTSRARFEAFCAYVLPQFELAPVDQWARLRAHAPGVFDGPERRELEGVLDRAGASGG